MEPVYELKRLGVILSSVLIYSITNRGSFTQYLKLMTIMNNLTLYKCVTQSKYFENTFNTDKENFRDSYIILRH